MDMDMDMVMHWRVNIFLKKKINNYYLKKNKIFIIIIFKFFIYIGIVWNE